MADCRADHARGRRGRPGSCVQVRLGNGARRAFYSIARVRRQRRVSGNVRGVCLYAALRMAVGLASNGKRNALLARTVVLLFAISMASPARNVRTPVRLRRPRGIKTRRAILSRAVALASLEGLESLTIGRLASALRMSKSGLFAHFGSKEELQCSAVEAAREIFVDQVIRPASALTGLRRLRSLCDHWFRYAELRALPGGCFFTAASLEYDDRPGRVRDRIVELMQKWLLHLERTVREAQAAGEVVRDVDPRQLAFEIHALAMGANWRSRLFKDRFAFTTARRAILERIDQIASAERRRR